jgi:energy-coupling factor transporter ATP-binding protein EcfA2
VIRFEQVGVTFPDAAEPTLHDVDLHVEESTFCLVTGRTGSGKSTLLGAVVGLVPRATGGHLSGRVTVAGRDTSRVPPRDLADVVGLVVQDPVAGFVADTVEAELAYGPEQLGLPPAVLRTRVEETLDLLGIADLRDRPLLDLSGGQQQRVAIGAAMTTRPSVLVLDEPTSSLDPTAAEEVLAALARLVHDLGVTVLLAEHRLERALQFADELVVVEQGSVVHGDPADLVARSPLVPPVVELGRALDWSPLPRSVREARRLAAPLRRAGLPEPPHAAPVDGPVVLDVRNLSVDHGSTRAVDRVTCSVRSGEVVALVGRNGSGKSSLLWAIQGTGPRRSGTTSVDGVDTASLEPAARRARVALVPQTPTDLLYLETVDDECAQADAESSAAPGTCRSILDELLATDDADDGAVEHGVDGATHPRDLSEGQRLALVLAVQLTASPPVVLLDEPTRGLDYGAKAALGRALRRRSAGGAAVVVATHDVEFAATTCDRTLLLAQGELIADGPTAELLAPSPMFSPQVSRVVAPAPWVDLHALLDALAFDRADAAPGVTA